MTVEWIPISELRQRDTGFYASTRWRVLAKLMQLELQRLRCCYHLHLYLMDTDLRELSFSACTSGFATHDQSLRGPKSPRTRISGIATLRIFREDPPTTLDGTAASPWGPDAVMSTGGWEDSYLSSVKKINKATSPRFSRTGGGAPDASKTEALCQPFNPISERVDSRVVGAPARPKKYFHIFSIGGLSKREENPPQGLHQRLWAHLRHRGALKISKNLMHAPPSQLTCLRS
jgi:hypothetical protein